MTQLSVIEVPFHQDTVLVIQDALGEQYIAMRPTVEALGLDWKNQLRRIQQDETLSEGLTTLPVPSAGGDQDTNVLPIELFHGWLFTLQVSRTKPEIQEKLHQYRRECFDVLHSYFTEGAAWNPRFHRQEFDRTRKIAGAQALDMAPVAFSVISRAAERVPAHQCVEFATKAFDLANQCLRPGEPCQHAQEHILKLLFSAGEQLHPDEVSALTRTTATQRSKLLRHLDASGFQIRKNAQGLYEHVPPSVASRGPTLPRARTGTAPTTESRHVIFHVIP